MQRSGSRAIRTRATRTDPSNPHIAPPVVPGQHSRRRTKEQPQPAADQHHHNRHRPDEHGWNQNDDQQDEEQQPAHQHLERAAAAQAAKPVGRGIADGLPTEHDGRTVVAQNGRGPAKISPGRAAASQRASRFVGVSETLLRPPYDDGPRSRGRLSPPKPPGRVPGRQSRRSGPGPPRW